MRKVRIVFEKDKGFMAWLICWLTKGDVNHCAFVYESTDWGVPWVAEAAVKGVRTVPERGRKWQHVFEVLYPVADDVRAEQKLIGESYDFAGFFLFGWFLLVWRLLKVKLRRPHRNTSGQFCSEFVARVLVRRGFELDPQWTDPKVLEDVLRANPDKFKELVDANE